MDDFLRAKLANENKKLSDLETEVITCPFVQVISLKNNDLYCTSLSDF